MKPKVRTVICPALKFREKRCARTRLRVVYFEHTIGVPWAQMRPLIACAFRHIQQVAFSQELGAEFIRRMVLYPPTLIVAKSSKSWWGRNTGSTSRVFVGSLFTSPRKSVYPKFKDMPEHWHADWQECMVGLTAHELWHRWQPGHGRKAEFMCELVESDAIDAYRREQGYTFAPPVVVELEPQDLLESGTIENCTDCHQPTRYWLPDHHTPLCPACCSKRNATYSAKTYFKTAASGNPQ